MEASEFIKIYFWGFGIAFIIEFITLLRVMNRARIEYQLASLVILPFLSWFYVLLFAYWVFEMIGWDYEDNGPFGHYHAWRLR